MTAGGASVPWPLDGEQTLDLLAEVAVISSVEVAAGLLRLAHKDIPALVPVDVVESVEELVRSYKERMAPTVVPVQDALSAVEQAARKASRATGFTWGADQ